MLSQSHRAIFHDFLNVQKQCLKATEFEVAKHVVKLQKLTKHLVKLQNI